MDPRDFRKTKAQLAEELAELRRRLSEFERDGEALYRALVENSEDIIMRFDRDGRHLYASPQVEGVAGIAHRDFIGKTHRELGFPADLCDFWAGQIQAVFDSGEPRATEFEFAGVEGPVVFEWRLTPERDDGGRVVSVITVARDITLRRKTEQKFRELFETMIEGFAVHEMIWDEQGNARDYRFLAINPAFENLTGSKSDNLIGRTVLEAMPGTEKHWIEKYGRVVRTGEPIQFENYHSPTGRHYAVQAYRNAPNQFAVVFTDITERKRAEDALQESEERFRKFTSIAPAGLYITDGHGDCLYANDLWLKMAGMEMAEVRGRGWVNAIHPDDRERVFRDWYRVVESRGQWGFEYRFRHLDGKITWIYGVASDLRDPDGNVVGYIGINTDITDRKRAEEAVRESEERFRNIFDLSPVGVVLVGLDFRFLNCNEAYCRFLGYSEEELRHKTYLDVTHPDDFEIGRREIQAIREGELEMVQFQKRYLSKSGRAVWGEITIRMVCDAGGRPLHFLNVVQDVTERKQTEDALEENRLILATAESVAGIGSWKWDLKTNKTLWSDEMFRLFGVDREEFDGDLEGIVAARIHPDDLPAVQRSNQSVITDRIPIPMEYRIVVPDGTIRTVWAEGKLMYDPFGEPLALMGYVRDVTVQRRMERELQNTQKLESLGVLAGGIAHDFNNILSGVLGNLSLARLDLGDRPDTLETLADAEKATLRAKDLTKQLLTFARGGAPVKTTASLQELIEESAQFIFRGSKIKPILTFGDNLPNAHIDPGQISQVFNNLFINAIQAMAGGGMVFVRAESFQVNLGETSLLAPGDYLRVTVADQGTGVPAEVLPKIFDPYFSTKKTGSGLGLSLSHSIVKQHGGTITADSEPGQGTTFTICLPASGEGPPALTRAAGIMKGSGRLLLIDDEPGVLRVVSMMVERLGYTVETAAEGRAGVEKYQAARDRGEPFDAVITDLTIPGGMGGIEVARELALINPGVKVIVASGYSDDQALSRPEEFGFHASVTKPVGLAELSRVIHEAVAGSQE